MIYLFWLMVVVCIGFAVKAYAEKVQKEEEDLVKVVKNEQANTNTPTDSE